MQAKPSWASLEVVADVIQQPSLAGNSYQDGGASSFQVLVRHGVCKKHKHIKLEREHGQQEDVADMGQHSQQGPTGGLREKILGT